MKRKNSNNGVSLEHGSEQATNEQNVRHLAAVLKFERKMYVANKIADAIEEKYGFYRMKCFDMALQGSWFRDVKDIKSLGDEYIETYSQQVLEGIKRGKIN